MTLKRKVSIVALSTLITTSMLVGCNQTDKSKNIDSKELLKNEDARMAIGMAVDKDEITKVILNNGSESINHYTPEGLAISEDGKDYRDIAGEIGDGYDIEKAINHWESAKEILNFDTVSIEILTSDSESSKRIGEFLQNQLQSNLDGLTVELKQVPFKQKQQLESERNYDLVYSSWVADYPDPLTFLETFTLNGKFGRNSGYKSEEYNKYVENGKNSTSTIESWNNYAKAEKILIDDGFIIPLYQGSSAYLEKDYVDGITIIPYGAKYAYKWAHSENRDKLNLTSSSDIPSLDISKTTDSLSFSVINNIMEGLVRVDNNGKVVEGMAKSWEASEDKKTWVFELREGAKWSNGDEVTAYDFEYSFKRTLNPDTASQYGFIMYDIVGAQDYNLGENINPDSVGVKAIGKYTLEINLIRPVNYFDRLMSFPVFFPQNQKFIESQTDSYGTTVETTLYNGPFTFSKWKMEDMYTMNKNENYWDERSVNLKEVNTKIVKEASTDVNLYEKGEVDYINISNEFVDKYKNTSEFKTTKNATTFFLLLNAGE